MKASEDTPFDIGIHMDKNNNEAVQIAKQLSSDQYKINTTAYFFHFFFFIVEECSLLHRLVNIYNS